MSARARTPGQRWFDRPRTALAERESWFAREYLCQPPEPFRTREALFRCELHGEQPLKTARLCCDRPGFAGMVVLR